ncbi:MAG: dephospho-CoA kinase [Alphaproteobacteria bacterium]|nr:MAG: dephospho-CoA kinase [Alphaproteobacteria bacterium]
MTRPVILGLTGSIGMGKSETARMFRRQGVPVFDADAAVHRLLAKGGRAVEPVAKAFPGVERDGAIDRKALGAKVFGNPPALRKLEQILHPLVRQTEQDFIRRACRRGARLVVLDIPLLYETGGEGRCDYVAVVSAPDFVQRYRVLARPGMTEERFARVLEQQMPDREKRKRADFVIQTGNGKGFALSQVKSIIKKITKPKRKSLRYRNERNRLRYGNHRA